MADQENLNTGASADLGTDSAPTNQSGKDPNFNEQRLNQAIQAFDDFLQNLLNLEQLLKEIPVDLRKQLMARVEHRVTSKLLEKKYSRTSASAILGRAVSSVQEISDILGGSRPVPDAPNKPVEKIEFEDDFLIDHEEHKVREEK